MRMAETQLPFEGSRAASDAEISVTIGETDPQSSPKSAKPSSKKPIRLLVADDHPVVRQGLSSCLGQYAQVSIIGEASDGQEAIRKAKELSPDIVLMDIDMPRMNGLTAADTLRKENPRIKVLVLSMHSDTDNVLRILQSGARGFVLKQTPTDELIKAIESVHSGQNFFGPRSEERRV